MQYSNFKKVEMSQYSIIAGKHQFPKITRAACGKTDDSRTDGIRAAQLSFAIMSSYIDLFAIDHPEVTSDAYDPAGLFLTDYCQALPCACN